MRSDDLVHFCPPDRLIIGNGSRRPFPPFLPHWLSFMSWDRWRLTDKYINGGTNHFGSPFNFPEEFMSVYRLHPLIPDMVEFRQLANDNAIKTRIPVVDTFRAKATVIGLRSGRGAISRNRRRRSARSAHNSWVCATTTRQSKTARACAHAPSGAWQVSPSLWSYRNPGDRPS